MADTKWDKSRDLIEDALKATRQLEQAWPRIGDHSLDTYWAREIDRATKSLQALRQAACAGQDMERIHQQNEEARWAK